MAETHYRFRVNQNRDDDIIKFLDNSNDKTWAIKQSIRQTIRLMIEEEKRKKEEESSMK